MIELARRISLTAVVSLALVASAAEPDLRALVGDAEYRAMGLDKLSPEERARLQRWIATRGGVEASSPAVPAALVAAPSADAPRAPAMAPVAPASAPAAPAAAPDVAPPAPSAPPASSERVSKLGTVATFGLDQDAVDGEIDGFRARVVGEFTGWDGKTVFKLDNGQVWRQSTAGTYRFKATDPEVTIERSTVGYKLRLVETKRSINVRRVK